jgi:hypothetical protein
MPDRRTSRSLARSRQSPTREWRRTQRQETALPKQSLCTCGRSQGGLLASCYWLHVAGRRGKRPTVVLRPRP